MYLDIMILTQLHEQFIVISQDMIFLLSPLESPVPLLPELVVELTQLLQEADVGLYLPLLPASVMESNIKLRHSKMSYLSNEFQDKSMYELNHFL